MKEGKRVLVIGSGGREHALIKALQMAPSVEQVYATPGRRGYGLPPGCTATVSADDIDGLVRVAGHFDFVVIGPEMPLCAGIVDKCLEAGGITIVGPTAKAAQLEGSKAFTAGLLKEAGVAQPQFEVFTDVDVALLSVGLWYTVPVIKADGLAGGKGVYLPQTIDEVKDIIEGLMLWGDLNGAGEKLIFQRRLFGTELSVFALTDGKDVKILGFARDFKRQLNNDEGPNTGGMASYSSNFVSEELSRCILEEVLEPTVTAMAENGTPYRGVLYAGLMIVDGEPYVLEYNVRLGDPEAQVVLPRLVQQQGADFADLLLATTQCGVLSTLDINLSSTATVNIVLAAEEYPASPKKGAVITGIPEAEAVPGVTVYHAGTEIDDDGVVTVAGGRVLNVVGAGETLAEAVSTAYQGVSKITWPGMQYRTDIGDRIAEDVQVFDVL